MTTDINHLITALVQMLEIQCKTLGANKHVLAAGRQDNKDVVMLSFLTVLPFEMASVELVSLIIQSPAFERVEAAGRTHLNLSYTLLLTKYASAITDAINTLNGLDASIHSFADASAFFTQSQKTC